MLQPENRLETDVLQYRVMECLGPVAFADVGNYGILKRLHVHIAERELVAPHDRGGGHEADHLMPAAAKVYQGFAQKHQAAAFGVDHSAGRKKIPDAVAHRMIRRQPPGKDFRESASKINSLQVMRELLVI